MLFQPSPQAPRWSHMGRWERSVRSRGSVSAPLSSRLVLSVRGGDGQTWVAITPLLDGTFPPWPQASLVLGAGSNHVGSRTAFSSQFSLESFQSAMMTNVPELFVFHSLRSCFHFQQPTVGNVRSCWKYPFQFRQVLCGWMSAGLNIEYIRRIFTLVWSSLPLVSPLIDIFFFSSPRSPVALP